MSALTLSQHNLGRGVETGGHTEGFRTTRLHRVELHSATLDAWKEGARPRCPWGEGGLPWGGSALKPWRQPDTCVRPWWGPAVGRGPASPGCRGDTRCRPGEAGGPAGGCQRLLRAQTGGKGPGAAETVHSKRRRWRRCSAGKVPRPP